LNDSSNDQFQKDIVHLWLSSLRDLVLQLLKLLATVVLLKSLERGILEIISEIGLIDEVFEGQVV
jgi:hypothetical protein